jgi:lipopolysaccharide transport system ATP-binding protein
MPRPIIEVNGVSKRYQLGQFGLSSFREETEKWMRRLRGEPTAPKADEREFWALRDVSFSVNPGEVVGIIGRNGAGKSTLLKILSRITEPTEGEIVLRGRVASLLEVGTGFHPELSGRENVFLNGAILGMRRAEIARKFDEIVAFAEVDQFIDTPVKRYSSGMYVRLAFAVAAHLEPEILIVDEVLAVGDVQFQQKCMGKMREVSQNSGRTVLFVSHNTGAVANLTRKCVMLQKGSLVMHDDTPAVIRRYTSTQAAPEAVWNAPLSTPHPLQITRLRMLDASLRENCFFELTEDFYLELAYEVRRTTHDTVVEAWLYSSDGTKVAILGDYYDDPSRRVVRHPGRYLARIRVPGDVLNVGRYEVWVNSCAHGLSTYDHREASSFQIVEHTRLTPRSGRDGLLSLPVTCEHTALP